MRRPDAAGPRRAIKTMSDLVRVPVFKVAFFGGLANGHLTMAINLPMNDTLAKVDLTAGWAAAQTIWSAYSPGGPFRGFDQTAVCTVMLTLVSCPFLDLRSERRIHA